MAQKNKETNWLNLWRLRPVLKSDVSEKEEIIKTRPDENLHAAHTALFWWGFGSSLNPEHIFQIITRKKII